MKKKQNNSFSPPENCVECRKKYYKFSSILWDEKFKNIADIKWKDSGVVVITKILNVLNGYSVQIKDLFNKVEELEINGDVLNKLNKPEREVTIEEFYKAVVVDDNNDTYIVDLRDVGKIKTINGEGPDEQGNVDIDCSCDLTEINEELNLKLNIEDFKIKTINGEDLKGEGDIIITGGDIDLTDYYNKTEVDNLVDAIPEPEVVDLTPYALKTELPSLDGLATEDFVTDAIEAIPEINLSEYALKSDLEEFNGLSTEDQDKLNSIEYGAEKNPSFKTINGESVLGDGVINLPTSDQVNAKANLVHTHQASDITETFNRTFVTANEKAAIGSNSDRLIEHEGRIIDLENASITNSDEKIKLYATDQNAFYLSELLDNNTLSIIGGKIVITNINGLQVTVEELNELQGVRSNLQAQIDALNSVGEFRDAVSTYADLLLLVDNNPNDMVIVLDDESRGNISTLYIFNGTSWVFSGNFKGGEIRDFVLNPIDLETETTGILPINKYQKPTASDIEILNQNQTFTSNTVEGALEELFQYANNLKLKVTNVIGQPLLINDTSDQMVDKIRSLKGLIASSLVYKGVFATASESLESFSTKIREIPNIQVDGQLQRRTIGQIVAPHTEEIVLNTPIPAKDISATLMKVEEGDKNLEYYNVVLSPNSKNQFIDNQRIKFDNGASVNYSYPLEKQNMTQEPMEGFMFEMDITSYIGDIDKIKINNI